MSKRNVLTGRKRFIIAGVMVLATALALLIGGSDRPHPGKGVIHLVRVSRMGALGGATEKVFGDVVDVAADRAGNLYILDSQAQAVRVFTREGKFLQTLGGPGRGPGEFFIPAALALDGRDRLYVLDRGNQRVEVFSPGVTGPGVTGQAWSRSLNLVSPAGDICLVGEKVFLLDTGGHSVVREITDEGMVLRSFGTPPGGRESLMRRSLAGGYLSCSEREERILHLSILTPELRSFSLGGESVWETQIPDYDRVQVQSGKRSVTFTTGRSGMYDVASSITSVTSPFSIVQVGPLKKDAASSSDFDRIKSYVVSNRDGAIRRLPDDLPRLVGARDGYVFAVRTDPYPLVEVYRVSLEQQEKGQ